MEYGIHLAITILIYVTLTVSLDSMIGQTGLISLAHAAIYGVGAYATAILTVYAGWHWLPALFAAIAAGMLASCVVSVLSFRIGGHYLILALFGFQAMVVTIILNWVELTNGPFGIQGVPRPFGMRGSLANLAFVGTVTAIVLFVHWRFYGAPMKAVLNAIRDDETVAESLGINVVLVKIELFAIAGGFAALAGALTAFYLRFVDLNSFMLPIMILLLAMVFVGGVRSILGAVLGPALLVLFPELFRFIGQTGVNVAYLQEAFYGLLLILVMLFRPQGLVGKRG